MAARFTHGDSKQTTVKTAQKGKVAEPRTRSDRERMGAPQSGNTMNGMPAWIGTGGDRSSNPGSVKGGASIAPKGPPGGQPGKGPQNLAQRPAKAGPGQGRYIGHKGATTFSKKAPGTMGGRSAWMSEGHRGRMERLAGKAKSFGEKSGKSKSNMY